jgi:hypothetical protein
MKVGNLFRGLLITSIFIAASNLLQAQEPVTAVPSGTFSISSAGDDNVSGLSDFEVELKALETLPAIPARQLPGYARGFYSVQHPEWPPLPADTSDVPAWDMGGDFFALDDRNVDYVSLPHHRKARKQVQSRLGGVEAMDVPSVPGGGGDEEDDGSGGSYGTPFSTNGLWLQITNVADGLAYLNLMNATDLVYEVWSKTNLLDASWNIEGELWPEDVQTNVMPFTVPEQERTNTLFVWARDWTGITSGGNTTPEWWFYYWFGTTNLWDTNLDSVGNTLLRDYQATNDPNIIEFSLQFTNYTVNSSPVHGGIGILDGTPYYMAVLVNDTNPADASWQPYTSTNVTVNLNAGDGIYTVSVGLKGLPANATQTWMTRQVTLDTTPPVLLITNPAVASGAATTVSKPLIQLQGLVGVALSSLTFDVSNALGVVTNQTGYWSPAFFDTNALDFTTNTFQCYDIPLTNGLNTITLHATDVAGNVTTTNVSYTLSYAGVTNAPVLTVLWPTNGTQISGGSFTLQALLDDDTAMVTATVGSNTVQGLVERSGLVWLQNLPLNAGTNTITITAVNAAGNVSTTNLSVVQSGVSVTIDPIANSQLNQTNVTVTGSISDTSGNVCIQVNGTNAYYLDDMGDWEADDVPVSPTGTAMFDVELYTNDPVNIGSQIIGMVQPAVVALMSYAEHIHQADTGYGYCTVPVQYSDVETVDWLYPAGGVHCYADASISDCTPSFNDSGQDSLAGGYKGYSPAWENKAATMSMDVITESYPGITFFTVGSETTDTKTRVMILPSGQQTIGQSALYLVMAQVINKDTGLQLAASAVRFVNQLAGTATEDVTNDGGSVWTEAVVSGAAGAQTEVTPVAAGNVSFDGMLTGNAVEIVDGNTGSNLTAQANTVIVGQQMNLVCQLAAGGSSLTNFQWMVPGYAVTNFYVSTDALQTNGYPVSLSATNNQAIYFWWADGATNRVVRCSATVNGKKVTGQATFNVVKPTALITTISGTVALDGNFPILNIDGSLITNIFALHYGDLDIPGINIYKTISIPLGFSGSNQWVQIINSQVRGVQGTNGTWYLKQATNVLDTYYPYPGNNTTVNDTPGEGIEGSIPVEAVSAADNFSMCLMFKPTGGQWVPLKVVNWNWGGVGSLSGTNWVLTSSNATNTIGDLFIYPQWTNNIVNYTNYIAQP